MSGRLVVLGPQHPTPNLPAALADLPAGPVALITAGWRHDEGATEALEAAVARPCLRVPIYGWFEEVSQRLPSIAKAYRARQERLVAQRELYRLRVAGAAAVVGEMLERLPDDRELVEPELKLAVRAARRVDDDLLDRIDAIEAAFPEVADSTDAPLVRQYRELAAAVMNEAVAVCVAGGHVAVLYNRMRFFGVDGLLRDALDRGARVACWSAGAMALTERVVLFYDDGPGGQQMPEVLGRGFGLIQDVALLPHASQRLRLDHQGRLAALAMRLSPARCLAIENGALLQQDGRRWHNHGAPEAARVVRRDGTLELLS